MDFGTITSHSTHLMAGGTRYLSVTAAGNVGVGTTGPSTFRTKVLEVADATNAGIVINGDAANAIASLRLTNSGTSGWDVNYNFPNVGDLGFFDIGAADTRMTLTSAGRVGVGTTAPSARLSVVENTEAIGITLQGSSTDSGISINNTGTNGKEWVLYSSSDGSGLGSGNFNIFQRGAGGGSRLAIDDTGSVIIAGTALPSGSSNGVAWDNTNAWWRSSKNVGTLAYHAIFYNINGPVGSITTNGSATAYNTSSDYRLKENVVPMSDALQRIGNLKPSRFNFIADDSVVVDGFIAHEVQEVVPEAITGEKDAMRDEEYEVTPAVLDDDGNEVTPAVMGTRSVPEYQGIDQSKLVPLLVGAVQELTARLEALENN